MAHPKEERFETSKPVLAAFGFLGPAVAAWVVLIFAAMGFYFLSVAGQ